MGKDGSVRGSGAASAAGPTAGASGKPLEPFLVLDENRFAVTALERLRRAPGRSTGSPGTRLVHISGPSGCGKSHLVRQFLREERKADPALKTACLTASEYAAEFAEAAAERRIDRFQAKYRMLGLLVLEDLAALEQQRETQQQLVAAVDEILCEGGRVVFTSRKPPGELRGVIPRLVNRCHGGTCAAVDAPAVASRARLLAHFAQVRQIALPREVAEYLAREYPTSARELQAAIVQLEACARRERSPLDMRLARRWLAGDVRPPAVTLRQISDAVARQFGVAPSGLRAPSRAQEISLPRQCAMFLARELTGKPLGEIARFFGRRNHSTVVHACRRVRTALADDPALRQHLAQIRQSVASARPASRA